MASRFADLDVSVDEFIEQQENENTKRKTEQNLSLLNQFLSSKNEKRSIEDIPSTELNLYLSEFIIKVRINKTKKGLRTKFFARYDSQFRKAFKKEELWLKYHERFTV